MPALSLIAAAFSCLSSQTAPELPLGTFNRPEDSRLWEASGSTTISFEPRERTDIRKTCKIVLGGGAYGGLYTYRQPKDWSPYEVLSFVVWSTDRRGLGIRVDDDNSKNYTTRYNGGATLEPGRNLIQVPIQEMKSAINPSKVRSLLLFVQDPPKGLTLYFEDIRLGARLTDKVGFIPYEKRLEFIPTTAVASPHFPLARPLAGGPLRALVVYEVEEGRDLSELMERLDLKVSPVSWGREAGIHKWTGIAYGDRSYNLSRRYLASSLQGPEKFDTMILSTPTGWSQFGNAGTEGIVERVRNRGEGLVLVFPFPGTEGTATWPKDLSSLSALVGSESDILHDNGYVAQARGGQVYGRKWRVVRDHPIVHGVPLEALPFEALNVQTYRPAPDAQVLIETDQGQPVLAVREVGRSRVVTFGVRCRSLTPFVPGCGPRRQWRDYRYWEVFYDLLARAALWSAHRDPVREGPPTTSGLGDRDPCLTLKQWKNSQGAVTDWQLEFEPFSIGSIRVTAPDIVTRGQDLSILFEPVQGAVHTVRLIDYAGGRRRTFLEQKVTGSSVVLPTHGFESLALVTEVEAMQGSRVAARGEATTYLTPGAEWNDYEVYGWSAGGISYLRDLQMRRLREFGLTTEQVGGPEEARESFRRGFRVQAMFPSAGLHSREFDRVYREYSRSGDAKLLVRNPSFADSAFVADQSQKATAWAKSMAPFTPLTMSLGDETSLTSYGAEFDFDFHPENIRAFREKMKTKFGDVATMNSATGSRWTSFEGGMPPTTGEARKSGIWGLWNEWRAHNDDLWTGVFHSYLEVMRGSYPQTRLSVSGTQTSHVFNGIDWAKLAPVMGAIADYTGRFQLIQRLCFNPEIRSTPWVGYGRTGPGASHQLWSNLSFDGAGTAFFWYPSLLNPDFSYSPSARDYLSTLHCLREGVGKEYLQTRRRFSPVGILWSPLSQRTAWTEGKFQEFEKTEAQVYHLLVDAGLDPFFISETEVAGGGLDKKKTRALVLPMTLSLGRGSGRGGLGLLPALERFHGLLIATHVATTDEFLQPRPLPEGMAARFRKLPATAEDLAGILAEAGVRPEAGALDSDGRRMKSVVVSVHGFCRAPDAVLLTVLRAPVGQKEVIGPDGVSHLIPDPAGGRPIETVKVEVAQFGARHFFDLRHHQELYPTEGRLQVEVPAGDAIPISVLPYGPLSLSCAVVREPGLLAIAVSGRAESATALAPHVVRMELIDPATGQPDLLLSRNLLLDPQGQNKVVIRLAQEDQDRKLGIRLTDILTGTSIARTP